MNRKQLRQLQRLSTSIGIALLLVALLLPSDSKYAPCFLFPLLAIVILDGWISVRTSKLTKTEIDQQPVIWEHAVVENRRIRHRYFPAGRAGIRSDTHWYMTFQTRKHGLVTLSVPSDVYWSAAEGARGTLQYQGSRFLYFRAE